MRLLLDTHIWLWAVMEPERLNPAIRTAIETEVELVLSVASLWEMAIKYAAGKFRIEGNLETFRLTVTRMRGTQLVIRPEHAIACYVWRRPSQTAAIRFGVSAAKIHQCPIVASSVMAFETPRECAAVSKQHERYSNPGTP